MSTNFLALFLAITSITVTMPNVALARWATYQDAETQVNSKTQTIYIKNDGSSIELHKIELKILKESAIADWAQYIYSYNPTVNTVKILEAKTILHNKTYTVDLHKIQDTPITSDSSLFESIHHIKIPFSHVDINSTVVLQLEKTYKKSEFSSCYYNHFSLGKDYIKTSTIHITSEIPLYIDIHDPEKIFTVQQKIKKTNNKKLYIIDIEQKNPFYKDIIDEESIHTNPKYWPRIAISSRKNNIADANKEALYYQNLTQQPLPILYKKIAKIAKSKKTSIEKINTVTSLLAEKITYLSDCRTIKSSIAPQSLQQVADTRLGDCKDFAIATLLILKYIGIPSKIASIYRGEAIAPATDNLLKSPWYFNHVLLKVELPTGPLWIDPANFVSMAPHIFPDIADRQAIILDVKNSHYEHIPAIKATDQRFVRKAIWDIKNDLTHIKGSVQFCGIAARQFTGFAKKQSSDSTKSIFIKSLGSNKIPVLNYKVSLPDLNSRIVQDLSFKYELTRPFSSLKTNTGQAILLTFNCVNKLIAKQGAVSDLYLGTPQIIDDYLTINNFNPIGNSSLNCSIQSPWANIIRTVTYVNNAALIHQQIEIKKSWIESTEFQSNDYKKLKLALEENFMNGAAIIFNNHLIL